MFHTAQPHHRFERIYTRLRQTGTYQTDDPLEEALVRLLLGETDVPEEVMRAYATYLDDYKREVVEAFLLAEAQPRDLHDIFRIQHDVIEVYQHLFFDTSVFHDRLDAEAYARNYPEDHDDGYGRELKINAIQLGLEYLKASFGRGNYEVSPTKAVRELVSQAYVTTKLASKYKIDSPKAKEARKWASTMVKSIESLPDAQDIEGGKKKDYLLKLRVVQENSDRPDLEEDIPREDIINRRTEDES